MTEDEFLKQVEEIEASYVHKKGIENLRIPVEELDKFLEVTKDAKKGYIKVTKIEGETGYPLGAMHHGYTRTFKEGISLYMETRDEWFVTSVVQKINWENNTFTTLNSVYSFEFKEDDRESNNP